MSNRSCSAVWKPAFSESGESSRGSTIWSQRSPRDALFTSRSTMGRTAMSLPTRSRVERMTSARPAAADSCCGIPAQSSRTWVLSGSGARAGSGPAPACDASSACRDAQWVDTRAPSSSRNLVYMSDGERSIVKRRSSLCSTSQNGLVRQLA